MTSLLSATTTDPLDAGLICDFDVTGSILTSDNTLKIYMYMANKGTGAKFLYCNSTAIPDPNQCQITTNYPSTNEIPGLTVTEGGFDLNIIQIRKGSLANSVSIKINNGTEVIKSFLSERFKILFLKIIKNYF